MSARSRDAVGALIATVAIVGPAMTRTAAGTTVPDGDDTTPVTAAAGTYGDEFCNTWITFEQAVSDAPEEPAEMAAFYAETGAPLIAEIREYAPDAIAEAVNAFTDAAEQVGTTGNFDALFTPQFSDAAAAIYPTFEEGCGIPVVEAWASDYAFGGVPETLAAGPTAFLLHNNSGSGEAHELIVVRLNDGVDMTADDLLALPEEQIFENGTFVNAAYTWAPDTTGGMVANLTSGRYVYACGVAEGSVNGAEGTGPPHFTMGMFGEFTVN
jgi:hypothetical protein